DGSRGASLKVQADRGPAAGLHRSDRGVPRRGLHPRDARALGRRPPRADPAVRRAGPPARPRLMAESVAVDRDRLVETASRMIGVHSFTGDEEGMARLMVELFEARGLHVQWQQVGDGRPNAPGTLAGTARR